MDQSVVAEYGRLVVEAEGVVAALERDLDPAIFEFASRAIDRAGEQLALVDTPLEQERPDDSASEETWEEFQRIRQAILEASGNLNS